jgi:hypothetical protein
MSAEKNEWRTVAGVMFEAGANIYVYIQLEIVFKASRCV